MKDNQLQICSFEQAQRLKAAGFDWEVSTTWYIHPDVSKCPYIIYDNNRLDWNKYTKYELSAPTTALALKWMRDVKKRDGFVSVSLGKYHYSYFLGGWHGSWDEYHTVGFDDTYEAAESALLDELLNVLETEKR